MVRFVLLQIIAHTISDFYFQSDESCADKAKNGFKSPKLYMHVLITFVCAWLLSFSFSFWWVALIIAVTHLLVDALKCYASKCKSIFFVDQLVHLIVIVAACYLWKSNLPECVISVEEKYIALLLGFLVCLKPSNIIIKEIFKAANIKVNTGSDDDNSGDLPNAGKLIGIVERLLSLVFVLLGQYEAVGFIIAAKSLLRFAEGDKAKSEYVLVGTLLSFSIAVFVGVAITLCFGLFTV
ncbi:MAG: DUF3307 domain-containing protein [Bacteroidales bacterium]|nr:DUF3307 domain-containing protein [Bacteroidales bacterium]